MKFPPKPKTPYLFIKKQDKAIFRKLSEFEDKKLTKKDEELVKFLYSQLEKNWRDPLEKFIDKMLKK